MNYPGAYSGQAPGAHYQGVPQEGYPGSQPYSVRAPQQYGAAPPQQYGAAPPQQYGAAPQQYGAAPPQAYGGAPQSYGGAPAQQYGSAPSQQFGGAPGYPQQPGGVNPEVMSWFRAVDQDNSGYINSMELSKALQSGNNRNFSVQACSTMIGMFDHQHTGRIDVHQFSQLFGFINTWTDAFKRADSDHSGSISVSEMMPVLQQQGYNVSPATVQLMVQKYGHPEGAGSPYQAAQPVGSASLGLDGFILINVQLRRLTDAFRQKDAQQKGQITIGYEEFIGMVVNTV